MPNTAYVSAVHVSQPGKGPHIAPIGCGCAWPDSESSETTYNALETGLRWQRGHAFAETSMGYVLHETYMTGGPWLFTLKAGYQIRLKD
jgi:hypothetical protein